MSQGFCGNDVIGFRGFTLVEAFGFGAVTCGKVSCFYISPPKVFIAFFSVVLSFLFLIGRSLTRDTPAVGSIVSDLRETSDISCLKHDGQSQDIAYAGYSLEFFKLR